MILIYCFVSATFVIVGGQVLWFPTVIFHVIPKAINLFPQMIFLSVLSLDVFLPLYRDPESLRR